MNTKATSDSNTQNNKMELAPLPCTHEPVEGPWDTIIIGSGISGLALAAAMSKENHRVLVLEQHHIPGGFTHMFQRKNFEWDVGVHYLGTMHEKSDWYLQIMALTEGRYQCEPFGEKIDTLIFPDLRIDMPRVYEDYKKVLADIFPHEKEGISQYLDKVRDTRTRLTNYFAMNLLPKPLTHVARATLTSKGNDAATTTTDEMMNRYIKDVRLKDVLDAQWGNIGMPRKRCSFFVHAAMLGYFLESGAVYPKGGASIFARELGKTIHDNGSVIRVKASVEEILVEKKRAIGVRLANGEEILAKNIVSSAGAINTYNKLLPDIPEVRTVRDKINALPMAYEYMNLFFGLDCSPAEFGIGKENYWIHKNYDIDPENLFWNIQDPSSQGSPEVIFLGFASMRDPYHGKTHHTGYSGQVVFFGTQGFFDSWNHTKWNKRPEDYHQAKDKIMDQLISAFTGYFPGMKEHIVFKDLATPLTYQHFSAHPRGVPYGLAPIPERYKADFVRPWTPIRNCYLLGQDLIMPGLSAAFGSAMLTGAILLRGNIGAKLKKQGLKYIG